MTRNEMTESLRCCSSCGHLRSSHADAGRCRASSAETTTSGADLPVRCTCPAYMPGELSAEGERAAAAQKGHRR